MMNRQRKWIKHRKKKRMRIIAGMLCFLLLFTTCLDIPGAFYVQAAQDTEEEVSKQSVSEGAGETEQLPEVLLRKIAALPDPEEYLAGEPDAEGEEAYAEWMSGLYGYAKEALAICEDYEALSGEDQARIPKKELEKLQGWEEIAKQAGESSQVMAVADRGTLDGGLTWSLSSEGVLTISGNGAMPSFGEDDNKAPWRGDSDDADSSKIKSVVIKKGVTSVGKYAFKSCRSITSVTIPDSVTSLDAFAFSDCASLKSVTIPASVEFDANSYSRTKVFQYCGLESVTIEGKQVGTQMFFGCKQLKTVNLSENLKVIGYEAFYNCTSLESIDIPSNVEKINSDAFNSCSSLTRVVFHGTDTIPTLGNLIFPFRNTELKAIIIPTCGNTDIIKKYKKTTGWSNYVNNIDEVSADSHDLETIAAKAASCEEAGNIAHYKCKKCSELFVDDTEGNKQATDAESVTIAAKGGHTYTYTISGSNSAVVVEGCSNDGCGHSANATLSLRKGADLTYTGSGIKPAAVIYDDNWKGTKNTNPEITYTGNTNVGTATASVTINGKTASMQFSIVPKNLTSDMIIVDSSYNYTGNAIEPVQVKDGAINRNLTKNTDYTITYSNNTNVGQASATLTGKGNYKGTVSCEFTIRYASLASDKSLTDYITINQTPDKDGWYGSDIILTPKSECAIGETPKAIGSGAITISEETNTDGAVKILYIKDSSGNIYQTEFSYKLDKTPPSADLKGIIVESGSKGLWGIIGKKNMSIKIPVSGITDTLSGTAEVTYTTEPDSGTGSTAEAVLKNGYYEISLNAEFSGIIKISISDKAGNTSAGISLTSNNGKIIAEDYLPECTLSLPQDQQPGSNGWYNADVTVTVTVTDNKDGENDRISGGIARIIWKDGEDGQEQTKSLQSGDQPVYQDTFSISVNTSGSHTYYVKAVDNAGNESEWKSITVNLDKEQPVFDGEITAAPKLDGAELNFTSSEGGKVYWIAADEELSAVQVAEQGGQSGNVKEITGGSSDTCLVTGLASGEKHTVYVVLEDAAGNLSAVKKISFTTLQAVPELTLDNIEIDRGTETIKLPESIRNRVEVYTNPDNPSGSGIEPSEDGSLSVEPGTNIYIRYPEKVDEGVTTPASGSVCIQIPNRPAAPEAKQAVITDSTVTVQNPDASEEYILVEKGQTPDWSRSNTTGEFTGLEPGREYELYVRTKATEDSFASEPARTEIKTAIAIKDPVIAGEGGGDDAANKGNTVAKPDIDGSTVTFTGTYGEDYTPVIKTGSGDYTPEMTWDEDSKGRWEYTYNIPEGDTKVEITVEFKKRALTGITLTQGAQDLWTIYADHTANESLNTLTAYLRENSGAKAEYDNNTKENVQTKAEYITDNSFEPKGADYQYIVSYGGKSANITLHVKSVQAAVDGTRLTKRWKNGGYTAEEVKSWLPAQITVTYSGDDYKTRTESRNVEWSVDSIGADFGGQIGSKTINGTVDLPAWATGNANADITINFVDKPQFEGEATVKPATDGAEIIFTSSEGGKVYWMVSENTNPDGTKPEADEVVAAGKSNGNVKDITDGEGNSFTITGIASEKNVTVYAVIEDSEGRLSEVEEISFVTVSPQAVIKEAKKTVEEVLKDLEVTNDATKESIQAAVEQVLKDAGITDVTVTVENFTKKDATSGEAGSIGGTVTIKSAKDDAISDSVTISKVIDKLPKTEEEIKQEETKKVEEAKKTVEEALKDIVATNGTTKENIQEAIDKALSDAGITDVTVTVGDLTKTDATEETTGSISGEITVVSKNDGSVSDKITINESIDRLPATEAEKVAAAKKIAESVINGIKATNDTTKESIQAAIEQALKDAGITDVSVTVGDFDKTEATKEAAGSIGGTVTIKSTKDDAISDSVTISKVIDRLPKTEEEIKQEETKKVEEAKKTVEEALKDITLDNDTTEESLQNDIQEVIDRTGIKDVTVTVEDFQKTEATTKDEGKITGIVVIRSGTTQENVTINKIIPKLSGKVNKEVNTDGEIPSMQIATSEEQLKDMLLEEAEKQLLADGTNIRIILDVKDVSGSTDKTLVEEALRGSAAAEGFTTGQYLDISLYKVIGKGMRQPISKTREKMTITIDVPDSLRNTNSSITRIYAVIRVHDGITMILNDLDNNVDTITIETDCFSTYAIVYKDISGGENDGSEDADDSSEDVTDSGKGASDSSEGVTSPNKGANDSGEGVASPDKNADNSSEGDIQDISGSGAPTGDNSAPLGMLIMFIIAAAGVFLIAAGRRKQH